MNYNYKKRFALNKIHVTNQRKYSNSIIYYKNQMFGSDYYICRIVLLFYDNFFSFFKENVYYFMSIENRVMSFGYAVADINNVNTFIYIYIYITTTVSNGYVKFDNQEIKTTILEKSTFNDAQIIYLYIININDNITIKLDYNDDQKVVVYYPHYLKGKTTELKYLFIDIYPDMVNEQFKDYRHISVFQTYTIIAIV